MPILDTPITTDNNQLKKVLAQKQPVLLVLYDSQQKNAPLEETLNREAKKNAGEVLIARVDVRQNPETLSTYGNPTTPALVTLTKSMFGRNVKSKAENIRPADIRTHLDHLLKDTPLPEAKPKTTSEGAGSGGKKPFAVTDATFRQEVLKSKTPVLVDFWAAWCGPCRAVAPFVDEMAKKYGGQLKVVKLNVDENPQTAGAFAVQSIPTFIVFKDGEAAKRMAGANPRGIETMIQEVVR